MKPQLSYKTFSSYYIDVRDTILYFGYLKRISHGEKQFIRKNGCEGERLDEEYTLIKVERVLETNVLRIADSLSALSRPG